MASNPPSQRVEHELDSDHLYEYDDETYQDILRQIDEEIEMQSGYEEEQSDGLNDEDTSLDGFIVRDDEEEDEEEGDQKTHDACGLDLNNIVVGKRRRKPVNRYVPDNMHRIIFKDVDIDLVFPEERKRKKLDMIDEKHNTPEVSEDDEPEEEDDDDASDDDDYEPSNSDSDSDDHDYKSDSESDEEEGDEEYDDDYETETEEDDYEDSQDYYYSSSSSDDRSNNTTQESSSPPPNCSSVPAPQPQHPDRSPSTAEI